jgi:hypothetical protein
MPWDPTNLQLEKVTTGGRVTNADFTVTVTIFGAGFTKGMSGVFVRHREDAGNSGAGWGRERLIPCNSLQVVFAQNVATAKICPRRKLAGAYDLIVWALPVPFDKGGVEYDLPVNDVAVVMKAFTLEQGHLPDPEVERAMAERNLDQMVRADPSGQAPVVSLQSLLEELSVDDKSAPREPQT